MESSLKILLFGGLSDERRVSVASAQNLIKTGCFDYAVFQALSGQMYVERFDDVLNHDQPFEKEYIPKGVLLGPPGRMLDYFGNKAIYFMGFHGGSGENGIWQKFLEQNQVKFTGCSSWACYLCYHKSLAREQARKIGVTIANGMVLDWNQLKNQLPDIPENWYPIVLKPNDSGSSVGLHVFLSQKDLENWVKMTNHYPSKQVIIEAFIQGRELTVGIHQDRHGNWSVIGISEVRLLGNKRLFDYEAKYLGQQVQEITPAVVDADTQSRLESLSFKLARCLGLFGYARIDFILEKKSDEPVFLEVNALPGLTQASFVPQQLEVKNLTVKDFVQTQIELGWRRYEFFVNQESFWSHTGHDLFSWHKPVTEADLMVAH